MSHSCWPTSEERNLLRAALLDRGTARAALDDWLHGVALESIEPGSQGMLPLVAVNLGDQLPAEVSGRFRGARRHTWAANRIRFSCVGQVLSTLDRRGIPVVAFKGLPLALLHYPSASARVLSDIDLWVPAPASDEALMILTEAGFLAAPGLTGWPPPGRHAWTFRNDAGYGIDLHAHFLADCCYKAADEMFLERASVASLGGARALVPDRADHALIVMSHGLRWNPVRSLRWAADTMMLIGTGPFDWDRLVALSGTLRLSATVRAGLSWVRRNLGAEVPGWVEAALSRQSGAAEEIELLVRVRAPAGLLGALPQMLALYVRSARGQGVMPTPPGFARYLGEVWGTASASEFIQVAAAKSRRRVRSVLGGRSVAA